MAKYDRTKLRALKAAVKRKRVKTPFTSTAKAVAIVRYDMRKFIEENKENTQYISYLDFIQRWTTALEAIPVSKFFEGEITETTQRPTFLQIENKDSKIKKETKKKIKSKTVVKR